MQNVFAVLWIPPDHGLTFSFMLHTLTLPPFYSSTSLLSTLGSSRNKDLPLYLLHQQHREGRVVNTNLPLPSAFSTGRGTGRCVCVCGQSWALGQCQGARMVSPPLVRGQVPMVASVSMQKPGSADYSFHIECLREEFTGLSKNNLRLNGKHLNYSWRGSSGYLSAVAKAFCMHTTLNLHEHCQDRHMHKKMYKLIPLMCCSKLL